jgi:hypothetical protein
VNGGDVASIKYCNRSEINLLYTAGYRFNNWLSAGLGVGLNIDGCKRKVNKFIKDCDGILPSDINYEDYTQNISSGISVPVYLDIKSYLTQTRMQPMISFKAGIEISDQLSEKDWWWDYVKLEPGIGCNYRITRNNSIYFLVSYSRMSFSCVRLNIAPHFSQCSLQENTDNAIKFSLGFTF